MVAGADGLLRDTTRPSCIPPLGSAVAERVVARTLTAPAGEVTHWTAAAMAKDCGISASSVHRIWRSHGLRPHQMRRFKLSNDPNFAAKLRDVVGLYVAPPAHAVVLSVDEKSKVQALDLTREPSNGPRTRTKSSPPSGAGTKRWIRSTSCIHDPAGCSSIAREIAGGRRGRRGCGASVPPLRHAPGASPWADTVGRAGVSGCWWGAAPGFLFAATPALSSAAPRMAVCTASCGSPLRCRAVGSGSG